jgi:hypothetical protein
MNKEVRPKNKIYVLTKNTVYQEVQDMAANVTDSILLVPFTCCVIAEQAK